MNFHLSRIPKKNLKVKQNVANVPACICSSTKKSSEVIFCFMKKGKYQKYKLNNDYPIMPMHTHPCPFPNEPVSRTSWLHKCPMCESGRGQQWTPKHWGANNAELFGIRKLRGTIGSSGEQWNAYAECVRDSEFHYQWNWVSCLKCKSSKIRCCLCCPSMPL